MYIPISNPAALEIPFISSAYGSGSIVSSTGCKRRNYMNLGQIKKCVLGYRSESFRLGRHTHIFI